MDQQGPNGQYSARRNALSVDGFYSDIDAPYDVRPEFVLNHFRFANFTFFSCRLKQWLTSCLLSFIVPLCTRYRNWLFPPHPFDDEHRAKRSRSQDDSGILQDVKLHTIDFLQFARHFTGIPVHNLHSSLHRNGYHSSVRYGRHSDRRADADIPSLAELVSDLMMRVQKLLPIGLDCTWQGMFPFRMRKRHKSAHTAVNTPTMCEYNCRRLARCLTQDVQFACVNQEV